MPLPLLVVVFVASLAFVVPVSAGEASEHSTADDAASAQLQKSDPGPRIEVYRSQRWTRANYPPREAYSNVLASLVRPQVRWGVFDGDGYRIPAIQFANVAGHQQRVALLRHRKRAAIATGAGLGGAGLGLLVGTAVLAREADPGRGGDTRKTNLESHQRGVGAGVFFGSAMIGVGVAVILATLSRQRHVARFYSKEEADDAAEGRNDRLRKALDLSWEDVQSLARPPRVRPAGSDQARPGASRVGGKGDRRPNKSGQKSTGSR